ncbi:RSVR protein, partial [Thinocorus orbignyianus]|nr:RSVR protein [Thinocorus orbignyianus]
PDRFQCRPGDPCFPEDWRCDGHPDCLDEGDELGCGTATPDDAWVTVPWSSEAAVPVSRAAAVSVPLLVRPSLSLVLLSILIAAISVAVWGLSRAKGRSDVFSPEGASREQLMPDKSQ